jgi:hypothetical protein
MSRIREVKPEIRVIGIKDVVSDADVRIIGVVFRGKYLLDGLLTITIRGRGRDLTKAIADMITSSSHYEQLRVIILDGIVFAGNIINLKKLNRLTHLPTIAIVQGGVPEARNDAFQNIGRAYRYNRYFCFYKVGMLASKSKEVLRKVSRRENIPEAIRVARLIAKAIVKVKSKV